MTALQPFAGQQFLCLETFRRNGTGVKTPVWFAQDGETLWVWTEAASGKAKRIRAGGRVHIVPSRADGAPLGDWQPAQARADDSPGALAHTQQLFRKKYGLMFALFGLLGRLRRARYTSIQITLPGG